jgi:hypothetical protein
MYRIIPVVAVALGMAVSAAAQDSTVRSKTKVSADDARTITLTGCLARESADLFTLRGTSTITNGEVTSTSKTETDVDDRGREVKSKTTTDVDHDGETRPGGVPGLTAVYELTPSQGVDLAPHVGKQVQILAVSLNPKGHGDNAKVKVEGETKIERKGARDSQVKSRTELELPRGDQARVTVVSVKPLGPACK